MSNALQGAYAPTVDAEQRSYTPTILAERIILPVWPEGIACDPFPGDMAPLTALAETTLRDGFVPHWPSRSYGNPPFNRLLEAMAIANRQPHETMLLGPAQTHRRWFWGDGGEVKAWLKPVTFVGFPSSYPKPLVLHYWGDRIEQFASAAEKSGLVVQITYKKGLYD